MRSSLATALDLRDQRRTRVEAQGELDAASADELRRAVDRASDGRAPVVLLDLRQVTFCDVAGLRAVIGAEEQAAHQGRHVQVRPSDPMRRVLDLTGLTHRLSLVD